MKFDPDAELHCAGLVEANCKHPPQMASDKAHARSSETTKTQSPTANSMQQMRVRSTWHRPNAVSAPSGAGSDQKRVPLCLS